MGTTTLQASIQEYWLVYILGLSTSVIRLLADYIMKNRELKDKKYYIQDFLYSMISIALGIAITYGFGIDTKLSAVMVIVMGLIGSTVIRKFLDNKEKIADDVVNKVESKI
jgi:putative effector of murein hydrolase